MIKKYSKEKQQEVITARKQGATLKEISSRTGVSVTTIKKWLSDSVQQSVSGIRIRRRFSIISSYSLAIYKINGYKRPPTFINREFAAGLFKTHRFRENLAFSICFLFGRVYAEDNTIRTLSYYKRMNSHFFSLYERSECFILWSGAEQCFMAE